jgi:uncharacterized damage-inducible protein DinB
MSAKSRCILLLAVLATPAALTAQKTPAPSKTVAGSVNEIWTDMEQSFIALADAMPEDKWAFKPTQGEFKDVRTFADQVKHVACANEAWAKKLRGEKPPARCDLGGPNPAKTKAEIMAYLKDSFRMMDDGIAATSSDNMLQPAKGPYGGDNRLAVLEYALWHASDHYGQLVVYLRLNGIVPPASR